MDLLLAVKESVQKKAENENSASLTAIDFRLISLIKLSASFWHSVDMVTLLRASGTTISLRRTWQDSSGV